MAAVAESGYQAALSAPVSGIQKVGVIIDTQVNDYYHALLIQLHDCLLEAGFQMINASLGYRREALPDILRTVYDSNVCGVILMTCDCLSIKSMLNQRLPTSGSTARTRRRSPGRSARCRASSTSPA